jgi:hypothetical protein
MKAVDHVREAEAHLEAAGEAQPTDEAALLVSRAHVHATLAAVNVAQEQTPGNVESAATLATEAATGGLTPHVGGDS